MGKSLIIVESPTKIKTLQKLLGPTFVFASSYGHIRDLPEKEFGIDLENNFEPTYAAMSSKKEVISKLKKAAKECDEIFLAPDPDREGEAIAWHISQILGKNVKTKRVSFNSITREAVQEALRNPREIDMALVNAQQARRLLDRLVGYTISPLLNRRLKRGKGQFVSAGRVQSVALKLVVEREREIEAFIPVEYWTIIANLLSDSADSPFSATLQSIDGVKIEKEALEGKTEGKDFLLIQTEDAAKKIESDLENAAYTIEKIDRKEKKRNPEAPFITSTLQQEASRHYRFSPSKTMQIAQSLYEGLDLGNEGAEGLITYMRTDSVRVSPEALSEVRDYIKSNYGTEYLPDAPRNFQVKKSAQDAHEAIRPTHLHHTPEMIRPYLTDDQFKLYSLIWKRFVASQMTPAIYDTVSVDIMALERYLFRATGSQIKFKGFLTLYEEKRDEESDDDKDRLLPDLSENELLKLLELTSTQSFTRPPPRYSEATLVKALEKSGIGRPSTYASIMQKIQGRDYTEKFQGKLKPTELGKILCDILDLNFEKVMDLSFTKVMEDDLEEVAEDKKVWQNVLQEFWKEFSPALETAEKSAIVPKETTEYDCPKCGGKLQKVWAKTKYFLGCENYPDCDYTTSLEEKTFDKSEYADDFDWEQKCPKCTAEMKVRFGKFGPFLGCMAYPDCKGIVNIPKKGEAAFTDEIGCPADGCEGHLVQRRSRFGKMFFSCSEYPACDVIGNDVETVVEKFEGRAKTAYVKKAKKATTKKKTTAKKTATKTATTKKTATKKAATKKTATKKTATKTTATKTTATKKSTTKKSTTKKKAS